nr:MAG TPA: hypothetical protein [Caudoviricetes sp.]
MMLSDDLAIRDSIITQHNCLTLSRNGDSFRL